MACYGADGSKRIPILTCIQIICTRKAGGSEGLELSKLRCISIVKPQAVPAQPKAAVAAATTLATGPVPVALTGLVYDPAMELHFDPNDGRLEGGELPGGDAGAGAQGHHLECPERIASIYKKLVEEGLVTVDGDGDSDGDSDSNGNDSDGSRVCVVDAREARREELELVHSREHVDRAMQTQAASSAEDGGSQSGEVWAAYATEVFVNTDSADAARLAAGSVIELCEFVVDQQQEHDTAKAGTTAPPPLPPVVANGFADVRPPGHHCEHDKPMGFCLLNNVAVAARAVQRSRRDHVRRVMIVDWDVHHGNGTQHTFYDDPSVLVLSIHRYDGGTFYPGMEDAAPKYTGGPNARGLNINVAFNSGSGSGMGDSDYLHVFEHVVLPAAHRFEPDLILVSCGFDAARGDPLGGYRITPEGYAHLTRLLMVAVPSARGRLVLALEGGYDLEAISVSAAACVHALQGAKLPQLNAQPPSPAAAEAVTQVLQALALGGKPLKH